MTARTCPECAQEFDTLGADGRDHPGKMFCTDAHKHTWHNRQQKRGKVVLSLLLVSKDRQGEEELVRYARREGDRLLRRWAKEDRAAGRRSDLMVQERQRTAWTAVDYPEDGA